MYHESARQKLQHSNVFCAIGDSNRTWALIAAHNIDTLLSASRLSRDVRGENVTVVSRLVTEIGQRLITPRGMDPAILLIQLDACLAFSWFHDNISGERCDRSSRLFVFWCGQKKVWHWRAIDWSSPTLQAYFDIHIGQTQAEVEVQWWTWGHFVDAADYADGWTYEWSSSSEWAYDFYICSKRVTMSMTDTAIEVSAIICRCPMKEPIFQSMHHRWLDRESSYQQRIASCSAHRTILHQLCDELDETHQTLQRWHGYDLINKYCPEAATLLSYFLIETANVGTVHPRVSQLSDMIIHLASISISTIQRKYP